MKNNLYIDGTDAFTRFGVFIAEGGHNEVVAFPALKAPEVSNDWAEYDGIEVDLSDPKLDTKELEIKFNAVGMYQTGDFISLLSDGAYHTFEFKRIGYTCKLRLVSEVNVALYIGAKSFSLKFADDFPLRDYKYTAPLSTTNIPTQGYEIDGIDFSVYGIRVLEGSEAQILKAPAVKKNMLRNLSTQNGAIYDGKQVVYQHKEATLNCCLIAKNLTEFWRNYNAFLHDLIKVVEIDEGEGVKVQTAERSLFVESTYEEYPCYYKSSKVSLFSPDGTIYDVKAFLPIWSEAGCTVIVDESFLDFTDGDSVMGEVERYDNLYVVKSMTKYYGAAGVRVGFVASCEKNIQKLQSREPLWKLSGFDAWYISKALEDSGFNDRSRRENGEAKAMLCDVMESSGLFSQILPSSANYICVKLKNNTAKKLQERLSESKILIRDCSNFDGLDESYVRFAVKAKADISALASRLAIV
jgi:hypothetical protein